MASRVGDEGLGQKLRDSILFELREVGSVAILPDHPDADVQRRIATEGLVAHYVDGTVSRLARSNSPGAVSVQCDISLLIQSYPGRDLRMILRGSSVIEERGARFDEARERRMREQALSGAAHSAVSRLLAAIAASSPEARSVRLAASRVRELR